jgi:hypothetical protein
MSRPLLAALFASTLALGLGACSSSSPKDMWIGRNPDAGSGYEIRPPDTGTDGNDDSEGAAGTSGTAGTTGTAGTSGAAGQTADASTDGDASASG